MAAIAAPATRVLLADCGYQISPTAKRVSSVGNAVVSSQLTLLSADMPQNAADQKEHASRDAVARVNSYAILTGTNAPIDNNDVSAFLKKK